mmetsp:Transcript_4228/g.7872  ORF Transcript_4228/g.7872 Transcript_4228/m.7872 type:complete len:105 (-) Transcript_4228:1854-2168(-)
MLNSSATALDLERTGPNKTQDSIRLTKEGIEIPPVIKFTYFHPQGITKFKYSKFGNRFDIGEDNLYKYDFPYAVQSLSSKDMILTNGASAHFMHRQRGLGWKWH